jgi:protein TonB
MSGRALADPRDRWRSAAIVGAIHAAIGYALLTGLGVTVEPQPEDPLAVIQLDEEPPPPPAEPMTPEKAATPTERPKDPEGAAAPPALRNTPTPVVAPEPEIRLPVPPPLPAAPVAGQGTAPLAGAAPFPGPGTGRGGVGEGLGSGRFGSGTGGGGGGGLAREPSYERGEIRRSDYPPEALAKRWQGLVVMRLLIDPRGGIADCRVTRSSGHPTLDAATCRLAVRRLRYSPARDTAGQAIAGWTRADHQWSMGPPKPDQWYDAEEIRD